MVGRVEYEAAIEEINSGLDDLSAKAAEIAPTANNILGKWYVPGFVKDAILWLAEEMLSMLQSMFDRFVELLKGAAAPVYMIMFAFDWADVKGHATGVVSGVDPGVLRASRMWTGAAAEAYEAAIVPQRTAAARIGTMSDKTIFALGAVAAAGLLFYLALGVIVVKLIVATVTAVGLLGSVVLSWAGAAIVVEEAAVNTALIIAAVSALTAAVTAGSTQMATLRGEVLDGTGFPGGRWPNAASGDFSDGTVTDGDADWSLGG